jgi:hypothetical protein
MGSRKPRASLTFKYSYYPLLNIIL